MEENIVKDKKIMGPICGWLVFTAIGGFLMMIGQFISGYIGAAFSDATNVVYITGIVLMVIYIVIYDLANRKTFDGCFKPYKIGTGFLILVPWLVLTIIGLVINIFFENSQLAFTTSGLFISLWAGVCEETTFRAVPAAHMMRCYNSEKDIIKVAVLTSVTFGLVHAFNGFAGADIVFTIFQIIYAFALGMLLCASYLRSGSILPAMICHFINDIIAFLNKSAYSSTGIMTNAGAISTRTWILSIINTVIYLVIAFYALRPKKRGEILQLWAEKWNKGKITE